MVAQSKYFLILIIFLTVGCNTIDNLPPDQLIAKGRQFDKEGKFAEAVRHFKRAVQLNPESADLHFELGLLYQKELRKSYIDAQTRMLEESLLAGNRLDKSDEEKLLLQFGYKKDLLPSALSEFNEALKYDPSHWKARYYIAVELFNTNRYIKAIPEFKKIIQLQPGYANSYSFLGKAYLRTGQHRLAVKTLTKAVEMAPVAENYYQLGIAYKSINDRKKVEEIARKLNKLDIDRHKMLMDSSN